MKPKHRSIEEIAGRHFRSADLDAQIERTTDEQKKLRPEFCGQPDSEMACRGCGRHVDCVKPGHCFKTEGEVAIKSPDDYRKEKEIIEKTTPIL